MFQFPKFHSKNKSKNQKIKGYFVFQILIQKNKSEIVVSCALSQHK